MKSKYLPVAVVAAAGLTVSNAPPASAGFVTDVKRYVQGVGDQYNYQPLLSVGDRMRHTTHRGLRYQMVGIPDGLGIRANADGTATVYMSHELENDVLSEPEIGRPLRRGAFVSAITLNARGEVMSGQRAFDHVYDENRYVGRAATVDNRTPGFGRFCSAYLAGKAVGFDHDIFFANEEASGASPGYQSGTFDPRGGSTVAVFDNEAHALPRLGHFPKENSVVAPGTGDRTVIMSLKDGPSSPDSQLYMYVGRKNRAATSVLRRNGLDNGKLYVFASTTAGKNTEADFRNGTINGRWVEIPEAEDLSESELEAVSDRKGAFGFIRLEDGAFSSNREFFFHATGGAEGNMLGRGYRLVLNDGDPTGPARLSIIWNSDQIVANGGDAPVGPDNMDVNGTFLMIQEDPTSPAREYLAAKGRDSSIWRYRLDNITVSPELFPGARVGKVNDPGRDGVRVPPGTWESSGIAAASPVFGPNSWILDVQAHEPTTPPRSNTVEDGQLLIMRPQRR